MKFRTVIAISFATASVWAGDSGWSGKAPITEKAPIEECYDLGGEISAGYRTDYILHGLRVDRDAVWVDVNYTFTDFYFPIRFGAAHTSGTDAVFPFDFIGPIDTTDVYLAADFENVAGFDVTVGYLHRFLNFGLPFIEGINYGELSLDIRRDLGFATFFVGSTVGLNSMDSFFAAGGGDGWLYRAGLEKEIPLCDAASLYLTGGVGYHDNFFYDIPGSSDWSHYFLTASLPIQLNCRTTLTPYIGYNGVQQWDVYSPQGDALHGGVSLSVSF
ncbi:MAG: hypothetical protein CMO55_11120 [Verrucomicrobiales bacterium]|nr:hypothetical protein [Verrucomicrobiales bacterium]